jgi:hypothetical protein
MSDATQSYSVFILRGCNLQSSINELENLQLMIPRWTNTAGVKMVASNMHLRHNAFSQSSTVCGMPSSKKPASAPTPYRGSGATKKLSTPPLLAWDSAPVAKM